MSNIVRRPDFAGGGITAAEKIQLADHAEMWIERILRTDPIEPALIVPAIKALYAAAKFGEPRVVIVPSPLVMAIAGGFASAIWASRTTSAATRAAIDVAIDVATADATDAAIDVATAAATAAAIRDVTAVVTDVAIRDATDAAVRDATTTATDAATRAATDVTADVTADATRATTDVAISDTISDTISDATRDAARATRAATDIATRTAVAFATDAATAIATYAATDSAIHDATDVVTRDTTDTVTYSTRGTTVDDGWVVRLARQLGSEYQIAPDKLLRSARDWRLRHQGGNMWGQYDCYLSATRDILGLRLSAHAAYAAWEACAIHGGFRYMHSEFCLVCDFPEFIHQDEQHRPHCADGPSHRWRDGWSLYYWHGVAVPAHWIVGPKPSAQEVLAKENLEKRRAGMEILGWAAMLAELEHRVIDTDPDPQIGSLVEVDLPDAPHSRFLLVRCATQRDFILSVPQECKTALEANAWSYNLPPDALRVMQTRT